MKLYLLKDTQNILRVIWLLQSKLAIESNKYSVINLINIE